jgi:hypothetical protein
MSKTLYATFNDAKSAEKAIGALLDHGARQEDISVIATDKYMENDSQHNADVETNAKSGITTTTGSDAAAGAAEGAGIGLGVGILAGLAAITIPGVGIVLGGGALAAAMAAAGATTVAGAISGGVAGYMADQGLPQDVVNKYSNYVSSGSALIAVELPTGNMDDLSTYDTIAKYGGMNLEIL